MPPPHGFATWRIKAASGRNLPPSDQRLDRFRQLGIALRQSVGVVRRQQYVDAVVDVRSEEHTSELQSLMRISYAVFFLKKKINIDVTRYIQIIHLNSRNATHSLSLNVADD